MPTATDLFTKTYADRTYRFPTIARHAGMVIAFAMDADRRIRYTVLDTARAGDMDVNGWDADPAVLQLETEIAGVGFGVGDQIAMPRVRLGSRTPAAPTDTVRPDELDPFLSSTARLTAAAPFQVLSDGRYVYVVRQAVLDPDPTDLEAARHTLLDPVADPTARAAAADLVADHDAMVYVTDANGQPVQDANGRVVPVVAGTLLVDRFVLVGTVLQPKLDVRFQRSRSRTRPASSTDTLGATDLENHPFLEPTQDLRFVPRVTNGTFAVALTPTAVADVFRWQLFTYDAKGDVLWSHSVARTKDGLFDTLGTGPLTCPDHPDLFALDPGSCPRPALADPTTVCGKTLVPQVDTAGGSGSALAFPASTPAVVTLDGAAPTGAEFTLEAWLKPDPAGTGERALLTGDGAPAAQPPSVWIVDGTTVRVAFGDGTGVQGLTAAQVLTPGAWNHLAVTFGNHVLSVYVDGVPRQALGIPDKVPTAAAIARIGGGAQSFAGTLDEVRVWDVALTAAQIDAGRHRRLVGIEGGLIGYWRLDEGLGPVTYDQSATGARGLLDGPSWVGSDAPVADPVGLTRSALRMAGRRVTGGLAATVYYQQESVAAGYGAAAKPLKQAARMLVTAVTSALSDAGPASAPTGPAEVTAFDLGIGSDGTLAEVPTELSLATVAVAGAMAGPGGDALSRLAAAQADVASLSADVAALTVHLASLRQTLDVVTAAESGGGSVTVSPEFADIGQLLVAITTLRAQVASFAAAGPLLAAAAQAAATALDSELATLEQRQQQLADDLAATTKQLAAQQAALAQAQARLGSLQGVLDGDAVLPMPLLHLDTRGLSVTGAVLGFAATVPGTTAPGLLDSALGRVTLYVRGTDDELLLAYYDTLTGRARSTLPTRGDSDGLLTFLARSTEGELDDVAVTVSAGGDPASCTVTIASATANVSETWPAMPREAAVLAGILSGTGPAPVTVGTTGAVPAGKLDALPLPGGSRIPVPAGSILRVGGTTVHATTDAARGATTVSIEPVELALAAGTLVEKVVYDVTAATSSRVGADLRRGSLLVAADGRAAVGSVLDGTSTPLGPTPACRWFAAPPGSTLAFDGTSTRAGVLARTAMAFGGVADGALLAASDPLAITGDVTVEAWIRPTALDGIRDIVVHGPSPDRTHEVYLRLINGTYQAGSYDGTDHFVQWPIPATDTGTWIHLAGVYGNGRWQLFRNGVLVAAKEEATGAVAVPGGWSIGCGASGKERFFAGDIDEVRIYSRALDQAEITDSLGQRLTGTEAGLVAYVYASDGRLVDHTAHATAVTLVGTPPVTTSPPAVARLTGFDVAGDVTLETWLHPTSTDDVSRVLVHASPASSYSLALRRVQSAIHLSGVTGRVALPDVPSLRITGRITLEAWVRSEGSAGLRDIVARGYVQNPAGEVYLRQNGTTIQLGRWTNTTTADAAAVAPMQPGDIGSWVHLAGVYDGSSWLLYRNGVLVGSAPDPVGAVPVAAPWTIGGSIAGDRVYTGDIDEVRIWNVPRSASDIHALMNARATGTEPGLVGVWRVDNGTVKDFGSNHLNPAPGQQVVPSSGALASSYTAIVTVGGQGAETVATIPAGQWSHVAAAFEQRYGIQLSAGGYLDAGDGESLDLSRDLTIEIGVQLDRTAVAHGLLSRGTLADGTADDVPYSLAIDADGARTSSSRTRRMRCTSSAPRPVPSPTPSSTGSPSPGRTGSRSTRRPRSSRAAPPSSTPGTTSRSTSTVTRSARRSSTGVRRSAAVPCRR